MPHAAECCLWCCCVPQLVHPTCHCLPATPDPTCVAAAACPSPCRARRSWANPAPCMPAQLTAAAPRRRVHDREERHSVEHHGLQAGHRQQLGHVRAPQGQAAHAAAPVRGHLPRHGGGGAGPRGPAHQALPQPLPPPLSAARASDRRRQGTRAPSAIPSPGAAPALEPGRTGVPDEVPLRGQQLQAWVAVGGQADSLRREQGTTQETWSQPNPDEYASDAEPRMRDASSGMEHRHGRLGMLYNAGIVSAGRGNWAAGARQRGVRAAPGVAVALPLREPCIFG
jgi:hypothetical protein